MNIKDKIGMATINGNTLTFRIYARLVSLLQNLNDLQLKQFSVMIEDGYIQISTPVTPELEDLIPGIIHGARVRARESEKPDPKPPTGGGDGTPPSGGTPGTPVLETYTETEARAA